MNHHHQFIEKLSFQSISYTYKQILGNKKCLIDLPPHHIIPFNTINELLSSNRYNYFIETRVSRTCQTCRSR